MNFPHIATFTLAAGILAGAGSVMAQTPEVQPGSMSGMHMPHEIYEIMEESKIVYILGVLDDSVQIVDTPQILTSRWYKAGDSEQEFLYEYQPSEEFNEKLRAVEGWVVDGKYEEVLAACREMYAAHPNYHFLLKFIGDTYYRLEQYDSAASFLERAIDSNFIDYQAHAFLSEVYTQIGEHDLALREITMAHMLNRNDPVMKNLLFMKRILADRYWDRWEYTPRYRNWQIGDTVHIQIDPHWLGYALVKAVWAYEPGYSEAMTGAPHGHERWTSTLEEREAVMAALVTDTSWAERLSPIIDAGYFDSFLLYEIIARSNPLVMLLLPADIFEKVYKYVDRFH